MKRGGRGCVGRAIHGIERYKIDREWREKRKELHKEYSKKYYRKGGKWKQEEQIKKLNEFANKRCKECKKLLNYKTKSGFCGKHYRRRRKKK